MIPVPGSDSGGPATASPAHDLNNQLGAILLYTELLLADTDASDPHYPDLQVIQQACVGAIEITRHLPPTAPDTPCPACAKAAESAQAPGPET